MIIENISGAILFSEKCKNIKLEHVVGTPSINMRGPAGIFSDARAGLAVGSFAQAPAKYSMAAWAVQEILKNKITTAGRENTPYSCYYKYEQNTYYVNDDTVRSVFPILDQEKELALAFVMSALTDITSETYTLFQILTTEWNTAHIVDSTSMVKFCDAFYYEFVKKNNFNTWEVPDVNFQDDILESEIQQLKSIDGFKPMTPKDFFPFEIQANTKTTKKRTTKKLNYENGECILPYSWSDEAKEKIPPLSYLEGYIPNKEFTSSLNKIVYRLRKVIERLDVGFEGLEAIGNDYINIKAIGKPASGKTTMANAIAAATGLPLYVVANSRNTEEDEFEGKTRVEEGSLKFATTDFLEAYEHGGIVVLEEYNLLDPGVGQGALGQAIEYPFILKKEGYKTIRRHPLCVIIATANIGTYGTNDVNQGLMSRFKQTYTLNDPPKDEFISILSAKGYDENDVIDVYNKYISITNMIKNKDSCPEKDSILLALSLRSCLGALECIEEGEDFEDAIEHSMIGIIRELDEELADNILSSLAFI